MGKGKKPGDGRLEFSAQELLQIEVMSGYGMPLKRIAPLFGRTPRTFDNYMQKYPEFRDAVERGRSKALMNVSKTAYDMAVSGDSPTMTMFWLRTQGGWRDEAASDPKGLSGVAPEEAVDKIVDSIASLLDRTREVRDVKPILLEAKKEESAS